MRSLSESSTAVAATCPHMMDLHVSVKAIASCPVARPAAFREAMTPAEVIAHWLSSRNAGDFPYDAVVAEFHRVGKHFVATELLEALAGVRALLPEMRGSVASVRLLDRFLDCA